MWGCGRSPVGMQMRIIRICHMLCHVMESRRGRTGIAKDIRTIVAASTTVYTYRLYIHTVTTGYSYSVYVSLYLFF